MRIHPVFPRRESRARTAAVRVSEYRLPFSHERLGTLLSLLVHKRPDCVWTMGRKDVEDERATMSLHVYTHPILLGCLKAGRTRSSQEVAGPRRLLKEALD